MTEYDFSPEAYERHIATQHRIATWVDRTEAHRPLFGNALKVPPSVGSVDGPNTDAPEDQYMPQRPPNRRHHSSDTLRNYPHTHTQNQRPPNRRHRSSDTLRTYVNLSPATGGGGGLGYALTINTHAHPPHNHSQPHSRSNSRHRPSKREAPAYLVAVPQAPAPVQPIQAYVYTHAHTQTGWAPAQGMVIIPPGMRDVNVLVAPSHSHPHQQQAYQPSTLRPGPCAGVAQPYAQSVYPPTAYIQPVAALPTASTAYPPPHAYPYARGASTPPPPPLPPGPGPSPYGAQYPVHQVQGRGQVPGPTPLRPEMFGAGGVGTGEVGPGLGRRMKKLKRSVSEVWFRR